MKDDVATVLEVLRTELLRDQSNSLFFVANSNQELLLVKKKINGELVWALPKEDDFKAFEAKIINYIKEQASKDSKQN